MAGRLPGVCGLVLLATLGLPGCGGFEQRDTRLRAWEEALGTGRHDRWRRHRLASENLALTLRFPGFIVGVEKSHRSALGVTDGPDCPRRALFPIEERWFRERPGDPASPVNRTLLDWMRGRLNDVRPHFISHVVQFTDGVADARGRDPAQEPAFIGERMLYSAYDPARDPARRYPFYRLSHDAALNGPLTAALHEAFAADPKPTHILVVAMGWNIHQHEAVENFNSLVGHLIRERPPGTPFRPLFVGVTWATAWRSPMATALSFVAKANDADEVGATWANLLVRGVLVPLKRTHRVPLVLIGHSLGARLLSRAAHGFPSARSRGTGADGQPRWRASDIDTVISLEGAFSARRFTTDGHEGSPYAGFPQFARKFICVWSRNDTATNIPLRGLGALGYMVGAEAVLEHTTTPRWQPRFTHFQVRAELPAGRRFERLTAIVPSHGDQVAWGDDLRNPKTVAIVDGSALIRNEKWGYAGGAHSDITTPGMARLLWSCLQGEVCVSPR